MLHTRLYFLFVFVFPKMEAPNFESIFECISDGVKSIKFLFLFLLSVKFTFLISQISSRSSINMIIITQLNSGVVS